ncbi:MAG: hypothetical protein PHF00_07375, partial [Elusimicrobia bacterium]|nr:hypothetical protein [Elusimicrobiota bacterium]
RAVSDHFRARRWRSLLPLDLLPEPADPSPRAEEILVHDEERRALAAELGLGENHVAVILYRAMRKLHARLEGKI